MNMIWKLIAFCLGYRGAEDVEDGRLVVFGHGAHFYNWRDAVENHWK